MTTHHNPELDRIELGERVVRYVNYPNYWRYPPYSWYMAGEAV